MRSIPALRPLKRILVPGLILALGLAAAPGASALPGVGKLKKSAEEKAAKAAGVPQENSQQGTIDNKTVVFDDVVLELTGPRLEQIIATYDKAKAVSAGRPALAEKLNKAEAERSKHMEKHGEEMQQARQKRDDAASCRHEGLQQMMDQKMAEYSQKALTDPAIRDKFTKIAQQYNSAAASGDSVAIKSAQNAMMQVILPTHDDTMGVYQKCPDPPGPLAAETQLAAMDKDIAALYEQIRQIDNKVAEAQAERGQMTREQFAMAAERIQMYLGWRQSKSYSKSATRGFTPAEVDELEKYIHKILAAMS